LTTGWERGVVPDGRLGAAQGGCRKRQPFQIAAFKRPLSRRARGPKPRLWALATSVLKCEESELGADWALPAPRPDIEFAGSNKRNSARIPKRRHNNPSAPRCRVSVLGGQVLDVIVQLRVSPRAIVRCVLVMRRSSSVAQLVLAAHLDRIGVCGCRRGPLRLSNIRDRPKDILHYPVLPVNESDTRSPPRSSRAVHALSGPLRVRLVHLTSMRTLERPAGRMMTAVTPTSVSASRQRQSSRNGALFSHVLQSKARDDGGALAAPLPNSRNNRSLFPRVLGYDRPRRQLRARSPAGRGDHCEEAEPALRFSSAGRDPISKAPADRTNPSQRER